MRVFSLFVVWQSKILNVINVQTTSFIFSITKQLHYITGFSKTFKSYWLGYEGKFFVNKEKTRTLFCQPSSGVVNVRDFYTSKKIYVKILNNWASNFRYFLEFYFLEKALTLLRLSLRSYNFMINSKKVNLLTKNIFDTIDWFTMANPLYMKSMPQDGAISSFFVNKFDHNKWKSVQHLFFFELW